MEESAKCDNLFYVEIDDPSGSIIQFSLGFGSIKHAKDFIKNDLGIEKFKEARIFKKQKFIVDRFTPKDMF